MELSYSHRFIFIHVYRVGGQSLSAVLRPYSYTPRLPIARVPVLRNLGKARISALREQGWGHIKAKELRAALPAHTFDSFYKFAFVRNPWDWQVSTYHYIRQRLDHPDHDFFNSFRSFDDYLDWRIHKEGPELQSEFVLSDSGELLVDFVGRYETLSRDCATVCNRIGIECSLPHRNRSTHANFRDYYSPQAKTLVADAYKDDIEFFGFDFDQQRMLPPIIGPGDASS